jgi:pimeloyl-ACP methyl ester carboxylesterase
LEEQFKIHVNDPGSKIGQAQDAERKIQQENCGFVFMVGYSYGGDSALIYANRNPVRVKGLAILGATLSGDMLDGRDVRHIWEQTLADILVT